MDISFSDSRMQRRCESERDLRRTYGANCAKKILARIADLAAVASLDECRGLPGHCHELNGDREGQLAIEVARGRRLIFEPAHGCPSGAMVWTEIDAIVLVEIVDYHSD
jgi:toxin HigB-1